MACADLSQPAHQVKLQSLPVQQGRIESWRGPPGLDQMSADVPYVNWILYDRNDLHLPSAPGAHERIDFVDFREQPRPCSFAGVDCDFLAVVVEIAELVEVTSEDGVQLIEAPWNVTVS